MVKHGIDEYKDRLDSPIGAIRIDPKTGKPIKGKKTVKKSKTR